MPKVKNSTYSGDKLECCVCLENKALINQPCGLSSHKICRSCITKVIESIPISISTPTISCQYPFSTCGHVYSNPFIKNILKEKYPIYKIASDRYKYDDYSTEYCPRCNSLLVFEDEIDYNSIYDCDYCLKSFCFGCKKESSFEKSTCYDCSGYNNINPNTFNHFFYKKDREGLTDYFYLNRDVDPEEACSQLVQKIENLSVVCPVCITPIQRSEQCNSLKHCHVEICYNCGKFTEIGRELEDHWSARGLGCARWESDPIYENLSSTYKCKEGVCYSHNMGDCKDLTHSSGKDDHCNFKKNQYVYHALRSLLPRIRYKVIDLLPDSMQDYIPSTEIFDYVDCDQRYEDTKDYIINIY